MTYPRGCLCLDLIELVPRPNYVHVSREQRNVFEVYIVQAYQVNKHIDQPEFKAIKKYGPDDILTLTYNNMCEMYKIM